MSPTFNCSHDGCILQQFSTTYFDGLECFAPACTVIRVPSGGIRYHFSP